MKTVKRRTFIKKSVMAAAMTVGAPAYIKGYMQNKPNETVNVAVIGMNGIGRTHYRNFSGIQNCRVAAICDCVDYLLPGASEQITKLGGTKPKEYTDYRKLLNDRDIDAVSVATPDYWHALMTINACQAGKDVYCEKPISYNIDEGRKMVQAARKYNRMVQVGLQNRSNRVFHEAVRLLGEGVIGDVYMGRGTVYGHRASIGRKPNSDIPGGVNWDLFRGPAPMIPFNENRFLYNWHWYWDTSTGEFGNNGVHAMDRIRAGMQINGHPVRISCSGGFYAWDSDQEVPNLQIATFEYDNGAIMELQVRSLYTPRDQDGLLWLGTKGYAVLGGNGFQVFPERAQEPSMTVTSQDVQIDTRQADYASAGVNFHWVNFIDAVRSRNYKDLNADILEGHLSTAQMHLGNIAYLTGRKLEFDGKTERFVNDGGANSYLTRREGGRKPFNIPSEI
jgi:predicted dehydrogenase